MAKAKTYKAADEADAPTKRDRKPVLDTGKKASGATEDSAGRQKRLQTEHAERVTQGLTEQQERNLALSTPIKLSTKEYVGKVPGEPHKDEEAEANKQGKTDEIEGNPYAIAVPTEFPTIDQKAGDKVVDQIVISDTLKRNGVPGAHPLNEPQKTQAAVDAHLGMKKC